MSTRACGEDGNRSACEHAGVRRRRRAEVLRLDEEREPDPRERGEGSRVPIREAEAAVGFGATDFLGLRGAVDAKAVAVETDPGRADGVVGAGREDEFAPKLAGFFGVGKKRGVEGVVGILDHDGDAKLSEGAFVGVARDAHGEMSECAVGVVAGFKHPIGEADVELGGFFR